MKTITILVALVIVTAQAAIGADIKNWPRWMQHEAEPTGHLDSG